MEKIITLNTAYLQLRQWCASDREPFAALNADAAVMEFFPATLTRQQSDALANKIEELIARRGWGFWAVELTGLAPFIGFVGLHVPEHPLPFSPCVEIGWRLAPNYWGKGYACEAATAALQFAFERLGLDEVVSFTAALNLRSQAVMKRLGMQCDGALFQHPGVPPGHPLRTHVLYRAQKTLSGPSRM